MLTITFLNQHSVALVCAVASASVFILLDLGGGIPFPSPLSSLASPLLGSRPPLRLGGLEKSTSCPSRSGQSPAAKHILVHLGIIYTLLIA